MLLQAPTYFKLKETKPGTVLIHRGVLKKEDISQRYGNRQFYFYDHHDGKLKCLSGGSLNYIIDLHNIDGSMELKVTYLGMEQVENGKFAGNDAHQFEVELLNEEASSEKVAGESAPQTEVSESTNPDDLE